MNTSCLRVLLGLVLSAALAAPVLAAPGDSCGTTIVSAAKAPSGTRVWYFGDQLVYEYLGGLSLTMTQTSPTFAFQEKAEKIVAVFPTGRSAFLVLTRQRRGFASYFWDYSVPSNQRLVFSLSRVLSFTENGQTTVHPLIDAYFDGTYVHLLTNFHLLTLPRAELEAGTYNPNISKIPFCDLRNGTCQRAVGLMPLDNELMIAQIHASEPQRVILRVSRGLAALPHFWHLMTPPMPTERSPYVNLIPPSSEQDPTTSRLLAVTTAAVGPHALFGNQSGVSLTRVAGMTVSAAFLKGATLLSGAGMLSYSSGISQYFRDGTVSCYIREGLTSVAIHQEDGYARIAGINKAGYRVLIDIRD